MAVARQQLTIYKATDIVRSTTAPPDTSKVWVDTSQDPPVLKTYDTSTKTWKAPNDAQLTGLMESIESHDTRLDVAEGNIQTLISDSYIQQEDGTTISLKTAYSSLTQDVNGITQRVESLNQSITETAAVAIKAVTTEYYLSTSVSQPSNGTWSVNTPTWEDGKYIWMRQKITAADGVISYSNPVCVTGNTGATGADGTGVTILGSYNTADELNQAHPTGSPGDSYIVARDLYVWDAANSKWVNVGTIQGPRGEQGVQGAAGADGVGVSGMVSYYQAGTSATTQPSAPSVLTWATTAPTLQDGQFLWVAYLVIYTDDTNEWIGPMCITDPVAREQIVSMGSELSVLQDQITSKVWKSDITEITDPINGDVSTLKEQYTNIAQDVDSIDLKVVDLTSTVNGIEVGGRNLIRNSDFSSGTNLWVGVGVVLTAGSDDSVYGTYAKIVSTSSGSSDMRIYPNVSENFTHEIGEIYTLSFYAKADTDATLRVLVAGETAIDDFHINTEWQKFSKTYTAGKTGSLTFWLVNAGTFYLTDVQLEKGTMATDWTPAPEDTNSEIKKLEASLELKIDEDELISKINASADVIHLKSNRLIVESDNMTISEDGTIVATNGAFSGTITANSGRIGGWTVGEQALFCETEHGLVELYPLVGRKVVNDPQAGVILPKSTILRVRGYPGINASEEQAASLQDFFAVNQDGLVDLWALRTETFAVIGSWLSVHGDLSVVGNAAVHGSLSTYGYTVPRIQHGQLTISVDAGVTSNFFFTFPQAFPGTPTVVLTPQHPTASPGASMEMHCNLTSVNDSRVEGRFFYTNGGTWTINWIAMYG